MLQLCPVGRCWIVLFVIVIGGLITTVDLIELETGRELINTDESVLLSMMPLEDEHDEYHDRTMRSENLDENTFRQILRSRSEYAAGHMPINANAHTLPNGISAEYESFLPSQYKWPCGGNNRMCLGLGDGALREILRSRSNYQSGHMLNKQAIGSGYNKGTEGIGEPMKHTLANAINTEYTGITDSDIPQSLYQCQTPQRQSINVQDPDGLGRTLIPSSAIVFTCHSDSGCCPPGHTCGIKTEEEVLLKFMALEEGETGKWLTSVLTMAFTNHTECKCQQLPRLPACTQRCPFAFRIRRRGTECVCDCDLKADDTEDCERIKDGKKPLRKKDQTCVSDGHCAAPACSAGQFDVGQGKCPKKPKNV